MPEPAARYHLRIQLQPSPDIEERAMELAAFCREHDVEEAVLFVAAEEWNNGLLDAAGIERWFEAVKTCKRALDKAKIAVSLNPWYTVLHTDRGRTMPRDLAMTPMVSPSGRQARAVASFACPNWQRYIAELYGRFAELGFRVIWVEDDFRYHNHAPLDWGGDFSSPMLARFAAKIGREAGREEVVAAILQPGEPHPWRRLWMETWREAQLEAIARIRAAVLAKSPKTQLGLMSSLPPMHSIEGRDWAALFAAMANDGAVVHRPHFASYRDSIRGDLAHSSFMLDCQKDLRPADLRFEVDPEIENWPMGPFTKSDTVTWGQMALAQVHGAHAQMLDLFSFTCQRLSAEPWVGASLKRFRPGLDELARLFPANMRSRGVGVLWRPDSALHARTSAGRDMRELFVPQSPAAVVLQSLGLAVQARPGAVNCLWGQAAWAYPDEEIDSLLRGGLWLDAEATCVLQQRGYGNYLPVQHGHWWQREEINYSSERPVEGVAPGCDDVWLPANGFDRVAYQTLTPGAIPWSSLCDASGNPIGVGMAALENGLGGRVACCAWPLATEADAFVLSTYRQALAQSLVCWLARRPADWPAFVSGAAYAFPIDMTAGDARRVAVFNAGLDPQRPVLHLVGAKRAKRATLLAADGMVREVATTGGQRGECLQLSLAEPLPFCGLVVCELA